MNRFLKKLTNLIFSRITILGVSILLQLLCLFTMFNWLKNYTMYMYIALSLLSIFLVIHVVNDNDDPVFKLSWIIPILAFPIFGSLFYIFVEIQPLSAILRRRFNKIQNNLSLCMQQDEELVRELNVTLPDVANLANYLYNCGGYPVYQNSYIKYFELGELKFERMVTELKKAEKFIFMEYFIIEEGYMWDTILKILEEKAEHGVDVRVTYDGTCSILHLPYKYLKKFKNSKIKFKIFSPIRPMLTTVQNNRDHRKILVIDGHTAFTGGVNISDEYINKKKVYGHWKDTAIMIKGNAVKSFTVMFLQMWDLNEKNLDNIEDYVDDRPYRARGYVIPYGDNPFSDEHLGVNIYMDIINTAKNYVHICSPYLIPNNDLISALIYAAKRGVDVKIIVPGIQDKKYCRALSYTYYPQLINAGVKIYHYTPGFIHAKSIVSDDKKAMVGTQNLDFRSLFLHFECGAFFCTTSTVNDVEDDFNDTLNKSDLFELTDLKKVHLPTKAAGKLLRLVAPLL